MSISPKHLLSFVALCMLASGCSGARDEYHTKPIITPAPEVTPAESEAEGADDTSVARPATWPPITITQDEGLLQDTLREIGTLYDGGFVAVNGLGIWEVGELKWENVKYDAAMQQLAERVDCLVQKTPHYYFIYPQGYESLLQLTVGPEEQLNAMSGASIACAFGEGTRLYAALALLSKSTGRAVVADNVIAETSTGELALSEVPWWVALEATLRGARLAQDAVRIELTDEYIFIASARSPAPESHLLNADTLTDSQRALLDKVVSVEIEQRLGVGARPLADLLPTLSSQLGVTLQAEDRLLQLPINPCVLPNIRVQTAIELLIRQWPLPYFAYRLEGDTIILVERSQGT